MAPNDTARIALLIDVDNSPADLIDEILAELSPMGVINIRRAYGNWTKHALHGWQSRLLEFAIRPMQQFDYSKGKNASDMAMTVDAMELLYNEKPDAFALVSSDADFTPLVMHLRAKGAAVYGFGAAQTPKPFVNACSRFLYLEALRAQNEEVTEGSEQTALQSQTAAAQAHSEKAEEVVELRKSTLANSGLRVSPTQLRQNAKLMSGLRALWLANADEQGWVRVQDLGLQIANKESFDARNYGYGSLSKFLQATQAFEFRDEGTARVSVRWRGC